MDEIVLITNKLLEVFRSQIEFAKKMKKNLLSFFSRNISVTKFTSKGIRVWNALKKWFIKFIGIIKNVQWVDFQDKVAIIMNYFRNSRNHSVVKKIEEKENLPLNSTNIERDEFITLKMNEPARDILNEEIIEEVFNYLMKNRDTKISQMSKDLSLQISLLKKAVEELEKRGKIRLEK